MWRLAGEDGSSCRVCREVVFLGEEEEREGKRLFRACDVGETGGLPFSVAGDYQDMIRLRSIDQRLAYTLVAIGVFTWLEVLLPDLYWKCG